MKEFTEVDLSTTKKKGVLGNCRHKETGKGKKYTEAEGENLRV